jgi:hypothetical protein
MERRLEEKRQLEQAREDAEKANKAREEMESKLSKVMLELEQTKKSLDKEQRADEEQQNLKPKEQQKENHLEYARKFFQDNSASSTPGTMTLLARELERDLHLTDLNIGTKTTTYYTPLGETKLKFLTPAKQVVQNHKEAIETQKEKLQDIIRSIKLLETINNSGQFNKDIEMEQEKYQRLKQMYIEQREELLRVEQIAERYQPTLESPEFKIPPIDYRRQFGNTQHEEHHQQRTKIRPGCRKQQVCVYVARNTSIWTTGILHRRRIQASPINSLAWISTGHIQGNGETRSYVKTNVGHICRLVRTEEYHRRRPERSGQFR